MYWCFCDKNKTTEEVIRFMVDRKYSVAVRESRCKIARFPWVVMVFHNNRFVQIRVETYESFDTHTQRVRMDNFLEDNHNFVDLDEMMARYTEDFFVEQFLYMIE